MDCKLLKKISSLRQPDVKQELLTKAFLNNEQIMRRINTSKYALAAFRFLEENQPELYQELFEQGDLLPTLWQIQIEAQQVYDKGMDRMINDSEANNKNDFDRPKEITTRMNLLENQIMRDVVLIKR